MRRKADADASAFHLTTVLHYYIDNEEINDTVYVIALQEYLQ